MAGFEKNYEGLKVILLKSDRGQSKNKIGILTYFKSEKEGDRYWPEEGKQTDEGKAARESPV